MSMTTVLGIILGFGLFISSIVLKTANYLLFLDFASFIMVIGGTLAATFIAFEYRYVINALKVTVTIMFTHRISRNMLTSEVGRVIRWGYIVQKSGLPGLENDAKGVARQDNFLRFGIDLVVTGYTGEEIRQILQNTIETTFQRSVINATILRSMGNTAPAFGMIGTLVGLIIMLDSMGNDPAQLGPGMSVALITTLYGVLAARLVFLPAASKIQQREEIVQFRNYLVAEGIALLAERKSPRYIQDKMNSYLDPAIHFNIDKHLKR